MRKVLAIVIAMVIVFGNIGLANVQPVMGVEPLVQF